MIAGITGMHAVVTGGGRGIGAAIASALAAEGARVTVTGRDLEVLTTQAEAMRATGAIVEAAVMDVTDEASVRAALRNAAATSGRIDVLVNNAGQAASGPVVDTSLETWNRVIAVNLTGAFLCARAVLPGMIAAGRGRIVSIGSTAGLRGVARVAAYSASKHGLIGLTRSLSLEVAQTGVTVNAVCPGYTESDMAEQAIDAVMKGTGRDRAAAAARIARSSPLGRLLTPEEVAASVVWLCSDAAAAITGEAVVLGG